MREIESRGAPNGAPRPHIKLGAPAPVFCDGALAVDEFPVLHRTQEQLLAMQALTVNAKIPLSSMEQDEATRSILQASLDGGGAGASEAMAYHVLRGCKKAQLIGSESEVRYKSSSALVDLVVGLEEGVAGVSVTRAFDYRANPLTWERACVLLQKKLRGLWVASQRVTEDWKWDTSVLLVWVAQKSHIQLILDAWSSIAPEATVETESIERLRAMPNTRLREYITAHGLNHGDMHDRKGLLLRATEASSANCQHPNLIVCHAVNMQWIF